MPHRSSSRSLTVVATLACATLLLAPHDARAWSRQAQETLGLAAIQATPSDFARQLEKHEREFLRGLAAPFRDGTHETHERNADGSGKLDAAIAIELQRVIEAIRAHRPFNDVAYQAGVLAHYVQDAAYPLGCSQRDRWETQYAEDFPRYLDSTAPRLEFLFYGLAPELERGDVDGWIASLLDDCREIYPLVGKEYRRTGKVPGSRWFDDRSTAFGVAGVAHSRAITATALALRYAWVEAGGADWRSPPQQGSGRLFLIPRDEEDRAGTRP